MQRWCTIWLEDSCNHRGHQTTTSAYWLSLPLSHTHAHTHIHTHTRDCLSCVNHLLIVYATQTLLLFLWLLSVYAAVLLNWSSTADQGTPTPATPMSLPLTPTIFLQTRPLGGNWMKSGDSSSQPFLPCCVSQIAGGGMCVHWRNDAVLSQQRGSFCETNYKKALRSLEVAETLHLHQRCCFCLQNTFFFFVSRLHWSTESILYVSMSVWALFEFKRHLDVSTAWITLYSWPWRSQSIILSPLTYLLTPWVSAL